MAMIGIPGTSRGEAYQGDEGMYGHQINSERGPCPGLGGTSGIDCWSASWDDDGFPSGFTIGAATRMSRARARAQRWLHGLLMKPLLCARGQKDQKMHWLRRGALHGSWATGRYAFCVEPED